MILITGASTGIGAATARMASHRGYSVCVNYLRSAGAAIALARELGNALEVQADVSKPDEVARLFDTAEHELGPITALVNNAGILEQQMRLDQMDAARIERVFATNVLGSFLCAKQAVLRMSLSQGRRGGNIVNVSSGAAKYGSPGEYVDYAASKAAVETMTIGLAKEVATQGIRVNCVRPGFIYTGIHSKGGEPDRVERVKHLVPMQRGGQPDEVAAAILWLISDEASYVTGTILDVSGGR